MAENNGLFKGLFNVWWTVLCSASLKEGNTPLPCLNISSHNIEVSLPGRQISLCLQQNNYHGPSLKVLNLCCASTMFNLSIQKGLLFSQTTKHQQIIPLIWSFFLSLLGWGERGQSCFSWQSRTGKNVSQR